MTQVKIVYWSGTGNTAAMAAAVLEGVRAQGGEGALLTADQVDGAALAGADAIAFGCPSMGAEVLEEGDFAPMFAACRERLAGKRVALFGSYGWGDGEWMRTWETDCAAAGIQLVCDSVICQDAPDEAAAAACRALGAALVG